ncbi:hypothetical protein ACA910_005062 [Epithemia clementina (nom. ined.)]
MSLDEALKFESLPVFQAEGQDEHPLNATVPSRSGLQWITVPKNCVGLVLRIEGGSTLQLIRIQDESQKVAFSIQIPVAVVHLAASDDGRLVCLACLDGSLSCYNATNDSFSERWTLPNAHSHVVSTLNESARNSRDVAASAAGPVRSLQFEPNSYTVLLVDAGRQTLTFVQADSTSKPVPNVIDPSYQVTCAAWAPTSESGFAIGKADGTIEIYQYSRSGQSFFSSKSQIDAPVEDDDEGQGKWVCTHLQWLRSESLAAGYCRVTSTDEEDDDDDDQDGEEDDGAEHEASFYVFYLSSDWTETKRVPLGDVVAFFSVPKHGRHVFYSCCVSTSQTEPLLLVASNVSSDVAVVALDEDEFRIIDIPEGANAAAPTDADDEFTYPIGIDAVVCTDGIRLLLNATDGSLSSWKLQNIVDSNFLIYPSEKSTELPTVVVDASLGQISSPNDKADSSASANQFGSGTEAPSFGFSSPPVSGSVAFGSGSATPSFGSGPFSFATAITQSTDASKPVFGATSSLGSSQPVFGEVSSLGANRITEERGTAQDVVSSSFSEPIFGSGKSAPVFGSSSFSFNSIGFGNLAKSPPFGAFRGAPAVSPAAAFAKPLFGTSPEPKATPVHLDAETTSSKPKASADGVPKSLTAEQNPYAEKAAAAFDLVDQRKAGKLPVSKMEVILEELGEGFHGEELENQIALIDDNGTGFLSKEAFVDWCVKLSEQTDRGRTGGHNVELDSDEEKEWQEQVELVETLFSELGEDGGNTLQEAKFAELVEGLGSTYCEDGEHGRAKKTLANDGIISITDFLDWYKNYLFGDDEEDYEEQEEQEGPGEMASAGEAKARPAANWGDTFKQEEGSWKCDVCSVLNKPGQTQCGACEAPRPGFESKASDKAGLGGSVKASIGSSGFVFGGPSSGFSFGSNSASNVPTQASSAVSRPEPGSTASTLAANPSISSTTPVGFVFVGVPVKTEDAAVVSAPKTTTPEAEKAARAFDLFDEDKSSKVPVSMMESILDELGEGFHGEELEQQIAEIDNKGTGCLSKEAFVDWYVKLSEQTDRGRTGGHTVELDSDEEKEWQEQVELVETLFSELGEDGGNTLQEAKFAELVEGLGSTYCEDGEHGRAKKTLANDGIISITDFLDWYKNYLFGDDEEDYEEQEEQEGPGEMASAGEAKARPAANWGDTFKQEEGSWKCDVCSVLNKPGQTQCGACEAPRPGFESKASDKAGLGGSVKASIGSSGSVFGGPSSGFSFGSNSASNVPTQASSAVSRPEPGSTASTLAANPSISSTTPVGFVFVGVPVKTEDAAVVSAPKTTTPEAEKAARAFDLFDEDKSSKVPVSMMESILDELGEGFHGEELEQQIAEIDNKGTGFLSKEAFVDWCVKLSEQTDRGRTGGHNVELDSDEEKEWQEQVELVETLFSELGEDGGNTLQEAKFAELVEGLGSTYCEDGEHGRAKKTLANDGIISITDFLDWYKNYLFGDDEEDYEEQEEQEGPGEMASAGEAKARPATNWGDTFKQEEGSWKCDVCSVLNKPGQTQCGACEAPRPGFEGKASDKAGLGGSVKASIGSSGFVFGGPSSGFSFGSNSASNVPTQASSALSRPEPGSTANTLAANPSISSTTPVGFVFVGVPVKTEDAAVVSAPKTTTPEAEKAARAFDLFDEDKSSKVPVSMMESILDELGEGFHGEELEQQIAEIDNKGTGFLSKEAFVDWYVKLSEQTDRGRTGGHTVELDSDEEEEWQEQVELVETLFSELGEDGGNTLQEAKFAELVKGLGSTYCEDGEHGRAKMSLANDAIISITDFLDWYKNYLFGDDEEDYEEQEEQEGPGEMASAGEAKARPAANWGDTFKQEEGSWKCDVCSVLNKPVSCVACEAPRPGFESKASDKAGLGGSIKASIGSSGFTFGIAAVTAAGPPSEEDKMEKETTKGFSSASSSYPPVPSNAPTAFDGASSSSKPASSSSSSYPPVPDKAPPAFAGTTAAKTASSSSSSSYPPVTNKAPSAFDGAGATGKIVLSSSSSYPPVPDKAPSAFDGAAAGKPASSLSSYPPVPKKAPSAFDVAATGKTSSSLSNYPPVPKKAPSAFDGAAAGKTASSLSSYPPVPKKARSAFDGAAVTTGSTSSSSYPPVPKKAPSSFGGAAATTGSSYPPVPSKAPSAFGAAASSSSSYPPVSSKASSASDGSAVERASSSSSSYPPVPNKAPSAFDGTPPTTVSSSSSYPPIPNKAPSVFTEAAAKTTSLSSSSYPPVPSKAPSAFAGASSSSSYPLLPTKAPSAFAGASSSSYPPVPSKAPSAFAGASPLSSYPPVPSKAPSAFAGASPLSSYPPVPSKARSAFDGAAATTASLLSPSYTPTQNDSSSAFGRSTSKDVFAFAPASSFLSKSSELATHNTARGYVGVFGFSSSSNEPSKFVPTKESSKFVPTQACSPLGYVRTTFEGPPPFCVSSKMSSSAPSNQSATSTDGIVSSEHKSTPTPTLWGTGRAGSVSLSKEQRVAKVESENTRRSMKGEPFQKNLSESTRKYISLVTLMEQSLASVRYDVDGGDRESAQRIADLAKNRQKLFASVAKAKALVGQVWERVPQLIASRAAVTARVEELHGILDQSNGGTQRDVLETQPLDMESERLQSSLSSKGMRVLAAVDVLRSRCRLWEDLVHENPKEMSEVLLNGHEQVRQLEEKSKNMKKRIIDLDTIQSLRVRPSSSNLITVVKQSARSGGQFDWNDIDGSSFKSLVAPSRMTLELQRTRNKKMDSSRSLRSRYVRESTAVRSTLSTANSETTFDEKSLFSPPQNVSPRDAWDQPSTTDQSQARRMMFDSPRDLRETSVEDESKAALRSYGTSFGGTRGPHMSDRVSTKTPQPVLDRQNESQQHGRSMLAARSVVNQTEKATLSQSPSRNLERQGQEGSLATTSRAKRISPGELEKDGSYDTSSPRGLTSGLDGIAGLGESIPSGGNRQTDDKNEKPGFQGLSLSSPKRDNNGEPTSNTDYHAILTQFYEKHNPSKLGSVSATLKKYQGRERDMFAKLAEKYGVLSPLETESQDYGTTKESTPPSSNLKSFQATSTFGPSASFSKPPLVPTPFSSKLDESSAPKFGSIAAFASPSGFGAQTTTQQPGTFSFGGSSPAPTPFTQSTASPAPWSSPLAGKSPREILASFYEQRNPSKLGEVDKVLAKYQGNEEQLFRNLAKKYNLDPSYFGLPTTAATPSSFAPTPTSFGSSSGFGQPSVLGGGPSPLGMPHGIGQSPGFGGGQSPSPMGGFGQPSILGGAATLNSSSPFGGPAMNSSSSFGLTTSSPGFSSFQSSSSGFGATAGSSNGGSTFGSLAQSAPVGGFGSLASSVGFGQSPPVSFGTSFGGPRR